MNSYTISSINFSNDIDDYTTFLTSGTNICTQGYINTYPFYYDNYDDISDKETFTNEEWEEFCKEEHLEDMENVIG